MLIPQENFVAIQNLLLMTDASERGESHRFSERALN
jgi:hypothetical protein